MTTASGPGTRLVQLPCNRQRKDVRQLTRPMRAGYPSVNCLRQAEVGQTSKPGGGYPARHLPAAPTDAVNRQPLTAGMPTEHPELLTRHPGRIEWLQLTGWLAEMWSNNQYTAIVTRRLAPESLRGGTDD